MAAADCGMEVRKLRASISSLAAEAMSFDLVTEILLLLPSKSLMRFKSVCKSWRALIISRYFCSLWRQHHQGKGILLRSLIKNRQHRYVPLSGPAAGLPEFELPRDVHHFVLQSCNGFLLHRKLDANSRIYNYWVYNPATSEVVVLPPLRVDACKIHARHCNCSMECPVLAFDSYSQGRVVALARHQLRRKRGFGYQVCVTEKQGPWRSSVKPFKAGLLSGGVYWNNFIVWSNRESTLFYDVGREEMQACAPPCSMDHYQHWSPYNPYHLESGGHLHFIYVQGRSRLIIEEMNHDLSGWFVKHNIEFSQIASSLFRSIGLDESDVNYGINSLIEEKEGTTLVMRCHDNVVLYRIQDKKSWKLCEWEFLLGNKAYLHCERCFYDEHIPTIYRFHDQ